MTDKIELIDERPVIEVVDNRFVVEVSAPGPQGPAYYGDGGPADWDDIQNKPTSFPPSAHTHGWTQVTDKPVSFPPTAHVHAIADVTGLQAALDAAGGSPSWASITGKPSTFTPSAHSHTISDTTGLQAALDTKLSAVTWSDVSGKPSSFTPSAHVHIVADITGLQATLDGKASTSHGHIIADVTGLQTALDGKAASVHTHAWADVTGKPTSFTPAAHVHTIADTTGLQEALDNAGGTPTWTSITDKPTTFAPSAHTHLWADITGKPTTFTPSAHSHAWSEITSKPTTFAPSAHTHGVADITATGTPSATTYLRGDGSWATPAGGSSNGPWMLQAAIPNTTTTNWVTNTSGGSGTLSVVSNELQLTQTVNGQFTRTMWNGQHCFGVPTWFEVEIYLPSSSLIAGLTFHNGAAPASGQASIRYEHTVSNTNIAIERDGVTFIASMTLGVVAAGWHKLSVVYERGGGMVSVYHDNVPVGGGVQTTDYPTSGYVKAGLLLYGTTGGLSARYRNAKIGALQGAVI